MFFRRHRLAIIAAIIFVAMFFPACGVATSGQPADDRSTVTLAVDNMSWCRVTVYRLYNGGSSSVRLGEVEALSAETFRVEVDDGVLHLGVRPFACRYDRMAANPVQVHEGSSVRLSIPPYVPATHSVLIA